MVFVVRWVHLVLACAVLFSGLLPEAHTQGQRTYSAPITTQHDSTRALTALRARLDQIFTSQPYRSSRVSVMVWSLKQHRAIYERNSAQNLTPASTTKLFSTAAYYNFFGQGAVITTDVRTDGPIGSDGVLRGNLYLVGHGDALLSVNDLEDLADKVRALGITRITGSIIGDGSAFDAQTNRAVYSGDYEDVQPLPPIVALTVNKGTVAIVASSVGGRVNVQAIPSSAAFSIVTKASAPPPPAKRSAGRSAKRPSKSAVKSSKKKAAPAKKSTKRKSVRRRYGDAPEAPRQRRRRGGSRAARIGARSSLLSNGVQQIIVTGSPGANRSATVYVSMARPALATAGVFADRLRAGGIVVDGGIEERATPQQARLLTQFRRPFAEFAGIVNKRSDNYLAEHVFKMVGSACGDHTNTAARAKRAMVETLDSLRVNRRGCWFNDGSGLSRRNVVSAATEVDLLRQIHRQPWASEYRSTLAIGAYDGTIRGRMHGTPAANNVTAKTGTLRNVSALAGYVTTRDGELLAFAFISNGPYVGSYKGAENLAAIALASFTYKQPNPSQPADIMPAPSVELDEEEVSEP